MKQYRIFDTHTHLYPDAIAPRAGAALENFYHFHVEGKGTCSDLCADAARIRLEGFLILGVSTTPHQVPKVNDGVAQNAALARKQGFKAFAFGSMHQDYPDMSGEVDRMEKQLGLHGIKLHPDIQGVAIDDPRLLPLYEIIEGRMPIYFHVGDDRPEYRFSEVEKLLKVMDMFPRLEVVAAHLGGYRAWDAAQKLAGHPNLWFDSSSSLPLLGPEEAVKLIRTLGTNRVMFASDYPLSYPSTELARFMALPLTEDERENLLYNNAAHFLHLND